MKSAGAIFPNRRPSNLPFVGRDDPSISNEREKKIAITNQTEKRSPPPIIIAFLSRSCLCASLFFFFRRISFCRCNISQRFVEGTCQSSREGQGTVVKSNSTVSGHWHPVCRQECMARARERRKRWRWIDEGG